MSHHRRRNPVILLAFALLGRRPKKCYAIAALTSTLVMGMVVV